MAAFDLDGTLVRGETVCEAIARGLGRLPRMRELERCTDLADIAAARKEMAQWYRSTTSEALCRCLPSLQYAPGVREGFALLQANGTRIAIVSITWQFAVDWFARTLGADNALGTGLDRDGRISHVWPADKARWLVDLAARLDISMAEVAAVGDSANDVAMLQVAGRPVFVGGSVPEELAGAAHFPTGDIKEVARWIVTAQQADANTAPL